MFKCLLLRNYKFDQSQTVHECSLDGPLQILRFCFDMKFKMAATAGLSLILDPMGKMFQNASSLKPLGQLNDHWKVLCFLCRSEIQDGHHRNT